MALHRIYLFIYLGVTELNNSEYSIVFSSFNFDKKVSQFNGANLIVQKEMVHVQFYIYVKNIDLNIYI